MKKEARVLANTTFLSRAAHPMATPTWKRISCFLVTIQEHKRCNLLASDKLDIHRSHTLDPKNMWHKPYLKTSLNQTLPQVEHQQKESFTNLWCLLSHMGGISGIPSLTYNFLCPLFKNLPNPTHSFLALSKATSRHPRKCKCDVRKNK